MTPADIRPIMTAIAGAIMRGHKRPVVLALVADSARAVAVHEALTGMPMPDVPRMADPHNPRLHLLVRPRALVSKALCECCGPAGDWLGLFLLYDESLDVDGWLVVVREDGLGYMGIKDGRSVVEGGRQYDEQAQAGPAGQAGNRGETKAEPGRGGDRWGGRRPGGRRRRRGR